jgi:WD40 repeat protein
LLPKDVGVTVCGQQRNLGRRLLDRFRLHSIKERCVAGDDEIALTTAIRTLRGLHDPLRLKALASEICAAIRAVGVDSVLVALNAVRQMHPSNKEIRTVCAAVGGQSRYLRDPNEVTAPGFVERQLCSYSAELGDEQLADAFRSCMLASDARLIVPIWTTCRPNPAFVGELGAHQGTVRAMGVLPDGRVVTGGQDHRVLLWDPAHPGADPVELGAHDYWVLDVAVLPDGRIASCGTDKRIMVWDPAHPSADPLELGTDSGWIYAVAALPDGRIVTGGESRRVFVWNLEHPATDRLQLGAHTESVRAIAALPDGRVVSVCEEQIRIWNPNQPKAEPLDFGAPPSRAWAVAALTDGRIVTAGQGQLCIWNPAHPSINPLVVEPLILEVGNRWVNTVAALPDGRFVTGDDNGRVRIWDPIHPDLSPVELGTHRMPVQAVAVSPNGRVISAGEGEDDQLLMWDPSYVGIRDDIELRPSKSELRGLAVLHDGRVITAGSRDGVRIWDPSHPASVPLNLLEPQSVFTVAVLPDSRVVIGRDRIMVWDPADPSHPTYRDSPHGRIGYTPTPLAMAVLSDGRIVSGDRDGEIWVWDPDYVPPLRVITGRGQSRELSTISEETGKGPLFLGSHDGPIRALAVLRDGRVVSGGADRRIRVWDPTQPKVGPAELGSHEGEVRAIAVLPDGRIATGGADRRIRVWDPTQPKVGPAELGSHEGEVRAIAVLPDGRIASGGADRRVRVWEPGNRRLTEQIRCSVIALATGASASGQTLLVVAHEDGGLTGVAVP